MKKEVTFSELWDNDIDPDDMPDDTIFVWKEREHKYILDPFRVLNCQSEVRIFEKKTRNTTGSP